MTLGVYVGEQMAAVATGLGKMATMQDGKSEISYSHSSYLTFIFSKTLEQNRFEKNWGKFEETHEGVQIHHNVVGKCVCGDFLKPQNLGNSPLSY